MSDLLADVLEAHGGLARWNRLTMARAQVVSGGDLFSIKGVPQDPVPRDTLLRRHDYHVDIAGGFAVTQYVYGIVEADGIRLPTVRRAFRRDAEDPTGIGPGTS